MAFDHIDVRGAREHNLKNIQVVLPRDELVVITGVSGSGKSSLAFDTIYAEGQRRYVESLSAYARQFLDQMSKPDVDSIEGLSPAISIEQKTTSKNPRSTVATVTEIYDYLRLLYARVGQPHCAVCGQEVSRQTPQQMVDQLFTRGEKTKVIIMAPVVRGRKGEYKKELEQFQKEGFTRVRVDGVMHELTGEPIKMDKRKKHDIELVIDRVIVRQKDRQRITDSTELALRMADGLVHYDFPDANEGETMSEALACPDGHGSLPELEPRSFSFNSPHGACQTCSGLGSLATFEEDLIVPDPELSLADGAIAPWGKKSTWYLPVLEAVSKHYKQKFSTPWEKLPKKFQKIVLYGSGDEEIRVVFKGEESRYTYKKPFEGVLPSLERRARETEAEKVREGLQAYQRMRPCPECEGARLRVESRMVTLSGVPIHEATSMSVRDAVGFFEAVELSDRDVQIAERVLKEIRERLGFLRSVGLGYLTLDRAAATLSGGEGQRIRLATQIGSSLVGVLYILDEPSIGLHQRDNTRLLQTLKRLRDLGNTVLVVEHDEETIREADWVLDLGPGAGRHGGEVVASGRPKEIEANPKSLTGQYLTRKLEIRVPDARRTPREESIHIRGACGNNLQALDVEFPLGVLTCVTGVSGSGKSTLVNETLYRGLAQELYGSLGEPAPHEAVDGLEHIDKIIDIDQSPIGRTPRSNPATYTGLFGDIRDIFASLPDSKMRGYGPGRFSFNVKGGRCETCEGAGILRIEMHFLPDVFVKCEACKGRRYNRETLEVHYKGRTIADVLEMTVAEALEFLSAIPSAQRKLQTLYDVGLGYIHLGQQATTLSGGEAQRVKLAKELSKRSTGRTMYVLDEPTTGLHFHDVAKLLDVLHRLVDQGNTVVVIEHNLDVVKTADWVIDLGPEGGAEGGEIVARGTPEEVAAVAGSHTGTYLRGLLTPTKSNGVSKKNGAVRSEKAPSKKASARKKSASKKASVKKAASKKAPAKKAASKKAPAKKAASKRSSAQKASSSTRSNGRKAPAKKTTAAKKVASKKAARKKTTKKKASASNSSSKTRARARN